MFHNKMIFKVILLVVFVRLRMAKSQEFFTSAANLEKLVHSENKLVDELEYAADQLQEYADFIRSSISSFKKHDVSSDDVVNRYVNSPINAFQLIKRLTVDLDKIRVKHNRTFSEIEKTLNSKKTPLPDFEDLKGIAELIGRLQANYKLSVVEIGDGLIKGIQYGDPLNSEEMYHLGRLLCTDYYFHQCAAFLRVALNKTYFDGLMSKKEIVQSTSEVFYEYGDFDNSLAWDSWYLERVDSDDVDFLLHKAFVLNAIKEKTETVQVNDTSGKESEFRFDLYNRTTETEYDVYYRTFVSLCNDELKSPENVTSRLSCHYKYGDSTFLRLAPLKLEQLYIDPEVYLIHDIVYESEAAEIKNIAKGKLIRSAVIKGKGSGTDNVRVNSVAHLDVGGIHPIVDKVFNRALDLTGLFFVPNKMHMQVNNYGVGGHYVPHCDYHTEEFLSIETNGNRLVTVLVYLSEVELGGGTAFPKLGVAMKPTLGKALYWKNLHASGEGDRDTLHGACPVLIGTKWAANIWIHTIGQIPKCGFEYRDENFRRKLPKLVETKNKR